MQLIFEIHLFVLYDSSVRKFFYVPGIPSRFYCKNGLCKKNHIYVIFIVITIKIRMINVLLKIMKKNNKYNQLTINLN